MKFNSRCPREVDSINHHLLPYDYVEENRLTHIDNPTGRIKYKDVRKISIGLSQTKSSAISGESEENI